MSNIYNKLQKQYAVEPQSFLWFLFFLIIMLTLWPFFKVGFTMADDLEYYITTRGGDLFTDAYWYAKDAGRFYFLITKTLYSVPYLIDNFYFTKIVQYVFLLLSIVLFAVVVKKVFRLKEFALLVFLLIFAFLPVTRGYHFMPIISYPFFFTFSFSIFLVSLLLLLHYMEVKKYKFLIWSAILMGISLLFYETYLIFALFLMGYVFFKNLSEQGKNILKSKSFYKEILPYVIVAIAYVSAYFLYRELHPREGGYYHGSSFAKDFSPANFFKVLWNFNRLAYYPSYTYNSSRTVFAETSLSAGGFYNNFFYILRESNPSILVKALLQCFVYVFLFNRMKTTISWKKIGFGILVLALFSFSVHILLGISEKYNSTWYVFSCYVTTFFSYFSITLLFVLVMYACFKACYKKKWMKNIVITIFTIFIFYVSVMIGFSNEYLSLDWQRSQNRFNMMEKVLKKGIFEQIPENAIIYVADMNETSSVLGKNMCAQGFTWKEFINLKIDKNYNIFEKYEDFKKDILSNPRQEIYYLAKYDSRKSQDMLMVLSKVNNNSLNLENADNIFESATSNNAQVYYYSPYKEFAFGFFIPDCLQNPVIFINDEEHLSNDCGLNTIQIKNKNRREEITSFMLKSSEPFSIKKFSVSCIGDMN